MKRIGETNKSMISASARGRRRRRERPVGRKLMARIRDGEAGMALIAVLWILVLLTAIIAEFARSMRTEVNITRNFKEATQAHYIAHAGLMRSVLEMMRNAENKKNPQNAGEAAGNAVWRVNAPIAPQPFGSGEFSVHIGNAAGLIDLNTAGAKLLALMVNTLDIDDRQKAVIVDSILDWRDRDDAHRLSGAENKYYQSLPNPYACKNGPFDAVEELLLVRGVNPALFYENLRPMVTVTPASDPRRAGTRRARGSGRAAQRISSRININAAPRQLLEALPQVTSQQVEDLMDYRTDRDLASIEEVRYLIGEQTFAVIAPYITLALSPYYTIRAEGRVSGSSVKQTIRAMLEIDPELAAGYRIVGWEDRYF